MTDSQRFTEQHSQFLLFANCFDKNVLPKVSWLPCPRGYGNWLSNLGKKKHLVTHFPKNLILAWVYFFNFYLMPLLSFWHFSCCHFYLLKLNQQVLKNETKFETHSKGRWHDSPASLYEVIANQMIDVHSEGKKSRNNSNNNATMICQWWLSYSWPFLLLWHW